MRLRGLVVAGVLLAVALAGCTEPRDIESEAKEREEWAADHNDHRPVAVLSGPEVIAPGALVWYSAHGSHDPDFFGAREKEERREASGDAGFHFQDDASSVHWDWYVPLDDGADGLGNGIRKYVWQVDDRPPLVAHELTHRYGSQDGPVRFPLGFVEPGTHTLTLTVIDWSGEKDRIVAKIEVAEGGTESTVHDWRVTASGWAYDRVVPVSFEQYGDCPPLGRSQYDATVHRMEVAWDLLFFADGLTLQAKWDPLEMPDVPMRAAADDPTTHAAGPSTIGLSVAGATDGPTSADTAAGLNLNDIGITLGHCETGEVWERFDTDQDWFDDSPDEEGTTTVEELSRHVEIEGAKTERIGAYDFNVYLSDDGDNHWGKGGEVLLRTVLTPATDTRQGGQ